jgi:hypothetical protein
VINMIHALVTVAATGIARAAGLEHTALPRSHLRAGMVTTAVILMVAHTVEVLVWGVAAAEQQHVAFRMLRRGCSTSGDHIGIVSGEPTKKCPSLPKGGIR